MLHGNASHDGFTQAELKPPFHLAWERHFTGERLGSAVEPIVADGKIFIATHSGSLYALHAITGQPIWRFAANGPFLHSPAFADGRIYAACADGCVYALASNSGKLLWRVGPLAGGFSASPVVDKDRVFIGSRGGELLAIDASSGKQLWRRPLAAPVRQTAAIDGTRVFVTSEDLRVHSFATADGKPLWTSQPLSGQTARDYYPLIVRSDNRAFVIVRTNPLLNMGQRIARDRSLLARNAGADDSHWKRLDDWLKSDAAHGNADLWAKEQRAVVDYLRTNPDAGTFFILDADSGEQTQTAPVLWVAGCQGVGAMPARTRDGRLLIFNRSAYGNWNHGVAPMVALQLLDLPKNHIEPLFHRQGRQPPWNCFWGTADESQNFVVAGDTVLIVHQGTLSGLGLSSNNLLPICGNRDTYGGFKNPPWARNEWHGPGRGGVAIAENRIYWQTGSRLLCIAAGQAGRGAGETAVDGANVPTVRADGLPAPNASEISQQLADAVAQVLSKKWAPLFTDPGLSGRVFLFDENRSLFESLAWAYPNLPPELKTRVKTLLAEEWESRPPFTSQGNLPLNAGAPREWFGVPEQFRVRLGSDPRPHPFGGVYAAWLYAKRCDEKQRILRAFPAIRASFADFIKTGWKLDAARGDLYANRYLSSLIAFADLSDAAGDADQARQARSKADETRDALLAWWRAAARQPLGSFSGSSELDKFIGSGEGLSFRVAPHRHKLALFQDLTPEVASLVRAAEPEAAGRIWEAFSILYRTWPLQGEERQVHFGENFVDAPDLALGAFESLCWLRQASKDVLARQVDLPFCHADLCYLQKLSLVLDQSDRRAGDGR